MVSLPPDFTSQILTLPLADFSDTLTPTVDPDCYIGQLGVLLVLQPASQDREIVATTQQMQEVDTVIFAYEVAGE